MAARFDKEIGDVLRVQSIKLIRRCGNGGLGIRLVWYET